VVDEFGVHQAMTPQYAYAPVGQRAVATEPYREGPNVSVIAALHSEGMEAMLAVEGSINGAVFEAYLEQVLCPILRAGDVVVLDNVSFHKSERVRQLIEACGARLWFLPSYSPDFSPIEFAIAKLKTLLRRCKARTLAALWDALAVGLAAISSADALSFFIQCGFLTVD